MSYFEKQSYKATTVVGTKAKAVFKAKDGIPKIMALQSSCGCTTPVYNPGTKELTVIYTPKAIPRHLMPVPGFTKVRQTVSVIYSNTHSEILQFEIETHKKK